MKNGFFWLRGAVFAGSLILGHSAFAGALTLGSINGVSSQDITETTKPIIYGGFTGGCTTDKTATNTETCNSCEIAPTTGGPVICNLNNAYDNLKVTFTLTAATAGFVAGDFRVVVGSGTPKTTFLNPPVVNGNELTVQMTWAEICQVFGTTTCSANIAGGEMVLSLKNSSAEDTITVTVRTRVETAVNDFYTDCDSGTSTGNPGVCHFEAFRGDGKIYAKELVYSEGYPTTSAVSGINYTGLVFFYAEDTAGDSDSVLIGKISSQSPTKVISVNTSNKKLSDNRITGLKNDTRYCVLAGNQDASGVISKFTPLNTDPTFLCQTPSEVVGLLDDKKCFIATAAFGSNMAPEVQSFRDFRNNFLLTNPVGKSFVRFYYKHSPYFANLISQSEIAKSVVRAALWPLLIFARVALVFGVWMTLFFTALGALGIYEVYRRFFIARRFRGEL